MRKNSILNWLIYGIIVVTGRRIVVYGFSYKIFAGNYIEEYIIGVGVALCFGIYYSIKNKKHIKNK